jgi:hypothetical protein
MFKNALICFSAGCLGALVNSLVVWLCGYYGLNQDLGVAIAPSLSKFWLYPRIVWGGLWGLLFVLPFFKGGTFGKGFLVSLFPSAAQLFVFFPFYQYQGVAGLELGLLTPVLVVFFNAVWGWVTAVSIRLA